MWTSAFTVSFLLGMLVLAVGYGRVLFYHLILRVLLVMVGTTLTIVAARKAVDAFLSTGSEGLSAPQVKEVDLGDLEGSDETTTGEASTGSDASPEPNEASEGSEITPDIDDEEDIEELADMVSETMKEDEGTQSEGDIP